jgi:hypothetical protein
MALLPKTRQYPIPSHRLIELSLPPTKQSSIRPSQAPAHPSFFAAPRDNKDEEMSRNRSRTPRETSRTSRGVGPATGFRLRISGGAPLTPPFATNVSQKPETRFRKALMDSQQQQRDLGSWVGPRKTGANISSQSPFPSTTTPAPHPGTRRHAAPPPSQTGASAIPHGSVGAFRENQL